MLGLRHQLRRRLYPLRLSGGSQPRRRFRSRHRLLAAGATLSMVAVACVSGDAASATTRRPTVSNPNPADYPESTALRYAHNAWTGTLSFNPYSPDVLPSVTGLAILNLAEGTGAPQPGKSPYRPEIASGWTFGKHSITFRIRHATWQNGKAITSSDVLDSLYLAGINGSSMWADVSSITAPGSREVLFHLKPWAVTSNVMQEIISIPILPESQYGALIPAGIAHDLATYWSLYDILHSTQATIQKASSSSAGKVIAGADAKLVKFNPKVLIGNGPYTVKSDNLSGVLYRKWMGWWDAKDIGVPWVDIEPVNISSQFGALLNGTIDFETDTAFPDPQVAQLKSSKYGHYVYLDSIGNDEVVGLLFHMSSYPYNLTAVRQAFAYLIERPKVVALDMAGSLLQNPPFVVPDGLTQAKTDQYLTQSQRSQLNHYPYDPARAAALLKKVGFTKRGGHWYTPKGKEWKVTIYEEGSYSINDEDGIVIANDLKNFGILASSTDASEAAWIAQQVAGDYPVYEWGCDISGTPNPIADFAATFAPSSLPAYNYPIGYNGVGKFNGNVGIGIGPIQNVPGLGKVNIASTLNLEAQTVPKSQWAKYAWDWARWMNKELPCVGIYNNSEHQAYGTSRYVDFPPNSIKWLWASGDELVEMMQAGYIHMRRSR